MGAIAFKPKTELHC